MQTLQHAPAQFRPPADRSFDVMLYTLPGTRDGLEQRWFGIGPYTDRIEAQDAFDHLCAEFPADSLVVVVLVVTLYDEVTGLYRDRILEARGRAPLIRREAMTSLTRSERKRLRPATMAYRNTPRMPRDPAVLPDPPRSIWPAVMVCIGGGGVIGLLLWAAAVLSPGNG